jgi:hypothetical protein
MGSKYQFRERGKDYSFENKNVFINHCQHKYQKSLHFSNPSEYYSYDFGETWNLISDFKSERQTIQNEKKPQNENRNHSTKSESKSGWGTYLIYVLAIWGGLSLINNKVTPIGFVNKINTELFGSNSNSTNKNNQEVVPNTQDTNSSDKINEEPIQNEVNSQTETDDNSSESNKEVNASESQTYTCLICNGEGSYICHSCEGKGSKLCKYCRGLGYIQKNGYSQGCGECLNKGVIDCEINTVCGTDFYSASSGGGCKGKGYVDNKTYEKQYQSKHEFDYLLK